VQSNGTNTPVIQPVIELNDLDAGTWDAASWNCCPQGYVFHSAAITDVQSGEVVTGAITQTGAASFVYSIVTTVSGQSTTLNVDLSTMPYWQANWIEVIYEAYYVTSCNQVGLRACRPIVLWLLICCR
jgi:hypothetical protein